MQYLTMVETRQVTSIV